MKKQGVCLLLALLLLVAFPITVLAQDASQPRVVDAADLLSDQEESALLDSINAIAQTYEFDVVLLTVNDLEGKTATAYADDYFDYQGYGYGAERDGVLFLISMEDRDWHISTRGYGITVFTDYGLDQIEEQVVPYLSEGQYYDAYQQFLVTSDEYLQAAAEGTPVDVPLMDKGYRMIFMIILALVIALIITMSEKSSMNSVRPQTSANQYLVQGSFALAERSDVFLYSTTTKTKKPELSSGGSSTHQSSSGATHGGSGGKF